MASKIYQGFTLVELLIVIAILAILSTLGVTNFQSARIKARDLARKSDLQTIAKSLEAYVNDHRSYPLTGSLPWGTAFTDPANTATIYVPKLPDNSDNTYYYESDGQKFTLYTNLENINDPSILSPTVTCGTNQCNYKLMSTNQ